MGTVIDPIEWNNGHFCYRLHPNGEVERGGMGDSDGSVKVWAGVYVDTTEALETAAAFFDAAGYARGCAEGKARIEELEQALLDTPPWSLHEELLAAERAEERARCLAAVDAELDPELAGGVSSKWRLHLQQVKASIRARIEEGANG